MPKRKTNSTGRGVLTLMAMALLGVVVFAGYVKLTPSASHVADDLRAKPDPIVHDVHPKRPSVEVESSDTPQLKVPVLHGEDVSLDKLAGKTPSGVKPMVFVATETLKQLKIQGAKAIGVDIKDRNALVDFNPALDKGYGSMEEGQLIKSLQWALGQFPEIDTFQIVIDGEVKKSLGQLDLTDPIPVTRPDGRSAVPETSPTPSEDPATP